MTVVPFTSVPADAPQWFAHAFRAAGHIASQAPDGWHVDDADAFQTYYAAYDGSADQLAWNKSNSFGAGKLDQLAAIYAGKFAAGFNYTGPDKILRTFQIDPTSQFNIDVQANASLGAIMAEVALVTQSGSLTGEIWDANSYFIAIDNSHMPTPTPQDMRTFALAVRGYVSGLILWNRALKDQIIAAADMKTLSTIDVTAGWPANS